MDVTVARTLQSVHDTLDARGIRLIVAHARSTVRDALRRSGTADVLGEATLVPSVDGAVEAIQAGRGVRLLRTHRLARDARGPADGAMPARR